MSGKRVTEFEKRDAVASKGMIQGEVAMAQSSPQRRRYLAERRRGLSQSAAMAKVGVSRSTAWRFDKLFHAEEAQRAEVRERYKSHPVNDNEDASPQRQSRTELSGPATFPMPPWSDSQEARRELPEGDDLDAEKFPVGLIERLERRENAGTPTLPNRHPANRGVTVARGSMPLSEDMGGRLSRPFLPEDPPNFLGGVV